MADEKLTIIIEAKDQFSRTMKGLRGMLPGLKTLAIGAGAAVGGLGTGLYAVANSTAKAGDEMQKMSLRLGLSSEMLSGVKHAVELSGGSIEDFERGVRNLARRMSDADEGLEEAERSFEALGIQVKNADGTLKDLDTMMNEASEGLARMEDNTKRVALAQELFGRSGTQLLPLMKQGAEGLRKMQEEAQALGITFDKASADQAAQFIDTMTRLKGSIAGMRNEIGKVLIPLFDEWGKVGTGLGKRLIYYFQQNREQVKAFAEDFLRSMGSIFEVGTYVGAGLADSFRGLRMTWQGLQLAFTNLSKFLLDTTVWLLSKMYSAFEKVNWGGVFDGLLESQKTVIAELEHASNAFKYWGQDIEKTLETLVLTEPAIKKVADMWKRVRSEIASLRAEGEGAALPPFDEETVERTKESAQEVSNFLAELREQMYAEDLQRLQTAMDAETQYIQEALDKQKTAMEELNAWKRAVTDETARAMQRNFSNLFLDVFTGQLKTIEDYFKAFTQSLLRAFSDMVAEMLVKWAALQAAMALGGGGGFLGGLFHEGGVVGKTKVPMRLIPLDMPQPVPRLHAGLGPNEFPAILERGETVIPKDASPGAVMQTVNVHNEILPNAGNVESLLQMSKRDWERVIEDKIIPSMRRLKFAGITP